MFLRRLSCPTNARGLLAVTQKPPPLRYHYTFAKRLAYLKKSKKHAKNVKITGEVLARRWR